MPTPEENMQAALDRAAKFRAAGNLERAAVWEASADRYRRIIDAKERIATAKENIEIIRENLSNASNNSGKVTSSRQVGKYWEVIRKTDPSCPSGTRTVRIEYFNGQQVGEEDLGCSSYQPRGDGGDQSSTSSGISAPTVNPTPATPTPPPPPTPPAPPVKTAPIDTILFEDDSVPIEVMTDLIFENIGGQEIINIVRNDTVNGQNIIYQPIKNMSLIQKQYNPNNIIALQSTSASYFANFPIKLDNKIPNVGNGPNGDNVYLDTTNGGIVVEVVNLKNDEEVEIEFIVNGTIYEAEI